MKKRLNRKSSGKETINIERLFSKKYKDIFLFAVSRMLPIESERNL